MDKVHIKKFTPKTLSLEEREMLLELYVQEVEPSTDVAYHVWQHMHTFFSSSEQGIEKYYEDYAWWYVDLTWRFLQSVSKESIAHIVATQMHLASILGYDIWKKIILYLNQTQFSPEQQEDLYHEIREAVLSSDVPFPVSYNGKAYTLHDVLTQIQRQESLDGDDSIKNAELMSMIAYLFAYDTSASVPQRMSDDITRGIEQIVQTIHFFLGVKPEGIGLVVRDYFKQPPPEPPISVADITFSDAELAEIRAVEEQFEEQADTANTSIPTPSVSPIDQIREDIASMNDATPEAILTYLDIKATELGNDDVRNLYYFDEQTGSFHWNTEMLDRL